VTLGGNQAGGGTGNMMYTVVVTSRIVATQVETISSQPTRILPSSLTIRTRVYTTSWDASVYDQAIPSEIVGGAYVQTCRQDLTNTNPDFMTFQLTDAGKVYVAYRNGDPLPSWLDGTWTDTGLVLHTSAGISMRLWRKNYPAGSVTLGGNQCGGGSTARMYAVIVKPQ
jgi:hypothetical protein